MNLAINPRHDSAMKLKALGGRRGGEVGGFAGVSLQVEELLLCGDAVVDIFPGSGAQAEQKVGFVLKEVDALVWVGAEKALALLTGGRIYSEEIEDGWSDVDVSADD